MQHCGPCPNTANRSSSDNEASDRAQANADAAAAEEQKQLDAEIERQRLEAEKRRAEELARQARFLEEKQKALNELRGVSTGGGFDSKLTGSGLKGDPDSEAGMGLKTAPDANSGPPRNNEFQAPTGLPKTLESEIPNTPAGDRVRKGFQAMTRHDWSVALAWFQDALNHDPRNAGIQRLVELAEYTISRGKYLHSPAPDRKPTDIRLREKTVLGTGDAGPTEGMDPGLAKVIDNFNRDYRIKHPELQKPISPSTSQPSKSGQQTSGASLLVPPPVPTTQETKANWKKFFDRLFETVLKGTNGG